jgi:hypothetical protein
MNDGHTDEINSLWCDSLSADFDADHLFVPRLQLLLWSRVKI